MIDKAEVLKLIMLANHNDNDNEANSAARLVCSMLEDYTFPEKIVSAEFDYLAWCQRHRKLKSTCGCK